MISALILISAVNSLIKFIYASQVSHFSSSSSGSFLFGICSVIYTGAISGRTTEGENAHRPNKYSKQNAHPFFLYYGLQGDDYTQCKIQQAA
jgi:hypothetical protein